MAKAKVVKREDLGFLGKDYQVQLVKYFIEEQKLFSRLATLINPNVFTEPVLRQIVSELKNRYEKTESVANYETLSMIFRQKITNQIELDLILGTLDELKKIEYIGIDLIVDYAEKFFKQQNMTKAINKALEIVGKGDFQNYDSIENIISEALKVNMLDDEKFFHPFDNFDDVLSEDYRCAITTGCNELDELLHGGLGKGELGVIIAPSSVGKTSSTTGFVAAAAMRGFKVLHIFFEDREIDIQRKYFAYASGVESYLLSKEPHRTEVRNYFSEPEGKYIRNEVQKNVFLYRGQTGEMTTSQIRNKINNLRAMGIIVDMVVVDYFEAIKMDNTDANSDSEWTREGVTMRSFERMANEFNVALWVPVQGSKDSFDKDFVGMGQSGGSVKKVQIAHVVISLARTQEQKADNRMNLSLLKFRGGRIDRGGSLVDVVFNNGTCRFDMSNAKAVDDALDGADAVEATSIAKGIRNDLRK